MEKESSTWLGFANQTWQVHKFGGTSVANANCYQTVAKIIEEQQKEGSSLCVVVSAMGGKPKVTDLLLQSVEAAARRSSEGVDECLDRVFQKHETCLQELFSDPQIKQPLLDIIKSDLNDIRDILKTVFLMKWQAKRISELVSGYGELWSAQILARLLQERNKGDAESSSFVYMDARRIITIDEEQDGAVVWETSTSKLDIAYQEELDRLASSNQNSKVHLVCTGYVASNTEGVATTLQRDGSDYSAAILGRLLRSTQICIWTDVSGVLSADPRRVPGAHPVPEVSYNEAMELAYFGAKVIHPKTMQPAISSSPQIPIFIKNTFEANSPGTRIFTASTTMTEPDKCVCGFSSIDNMALINVEGSGLIGVHGVAKRLFGTLERVGVNVVLISQASSEHSITFATIQDQAQTAKEAITEEFFKELEQEKITDIDIRLNCSIIAAVGDGMQFVCGVSGRFFGAMGDAQINVLAISQGCSERNISAVVSQSQSTRALRALHAAFRLSHTTVRVGIVGINDVGESLLQLLEVQRPILRETFDIDLQVCSVAMDSSDTSIMYLANENGGEGADSITMSGIKSATAAPSDIIKSSFSKDLSPILPHLFREDCAHHVVFDCTNEDAASQFHPKWLEVGVHVVTANNTGLSGTLTLRDAIEKAENLHGKLSAQYLREVTVGGGLPIINTLRSLLNSGDKIRRVDGIFSVSMSYIMYRISPPPPESGESSKFDQVNSNGAFKGDIQPPNGNISLETPCSFSQAVQEAISLGLMEKDITHDLSNEYTTRVLMVLAKELGLGNTLSRNEIQSQSEVLAASLSEEIDEKIRQRVEDATKRGCVLRQLGSIDVAAQSIDIKVVEVPNHHVFAVAPPSCEIVRFFTHRYQSYPLVISGPAAGADCTSSALLAEVLSLMNNKVGTKSGTLSRTGSSAFLT